MSNLASDVIGLHNYLGMQTAADEINRIVLNLVIIHRPYLTPTDDWLCRTCNDTYPCQTLRTLDENVLDLETTSELLGIEE